jgi:hypothetical protein
MQFRGVDVVHKTGVAFQKLLKVKMGFLLLPLQTNCPSKNLTLPLLKSDLNMVLKAGFPLKATRLCKKQPK